MDYRDAPRLQSQHAAGRLAKVVHVCTLCRWWHEQPEPPVQCRNPDCGGIQFDRFQSKTEATRWNTLVGLEQAGHITGLRRQVWFPLYAYGPNGEKIEVAGYVTDFVYFRAGERILEDVKPRSGIDDLARLKLKWMHAMALPVEITLG